MNIRQYVVARMPYIFIELGMLVIVFCVLQAVVVSRAVVYLIIGLQLVGEVLILVWDYARLHSFYASLEHLIREKGETRWVADLLERPFFLEGQLTYDALYELAKISNDEIAASQRQLKDYREFIETWVHEAKSPLAAGNLSLENMQDLLICADMSEQERTQALSKLDALSSSLSRTEDYIEQALFYARSESLDRDYLIRSYNLRDIVSDAIRAKAQVLIAAHITPELGNLSFKVFTDAKWMNFILGQIIQNSAQYAARPQGGRLYCDAQLCEAGTARERIELCVADNGRGVSASELARVFDKGFTGALGRTHAQSTGIGLYLVAQLCAKMGVSLRAESELGKGFSVYLSFSTNQFHYFESESQDA
ncbi:sensor histidine kinase [Collinsella sp. zg1085]|uniref:sensor histidine kinase n=1 Tax=Collinsella sp. zg1085 TaxID=2844380 RepID=UPI001C0E8A38|nr:sensor histidine kinase [Collinsella sp. zg1085]QWT17988.1 sensor histidine kinase [Collinsella sp. zg1085]